MSSIAAPTAPMITFSREFSEKIKNLIQPNRFNIVLRLYRLNETLSSGLVMPGKTHADANKIEARGQIIVLGPECFKGKEHPSGNALGLVPGDWVLIHSYAGGQVDCVPYPDEEFRLIADTEILAKLTDPEMVKAKW